MAGPTAVQQQLKAAYTAQTDAQFALHFANLELVKRGWQDPAYVSARRALEGVTAELAQAKWRLGRMGGTHDSFAMPLDADSGVDAVLDKFARVSDWSNQIAENCRIGVDAPDIEVDIHREPGSEISFSGDVPLVPSISPIVVLRGSNREMGFQYAQQIIEIFGRWIFEPQADRAFTDEESAVLRKWEAQLATHMPEILEFVRGWSEGATAAGLPMSYDAVLTIWTGTRPYSKTHRSFAFADGEDSEGEDKTLAAYLGVGNEIAQGMPELPDRCSGVCAWGAGTADGRLVAGATTDHDCTFQATIVAYPNEGNAFIYTPFSVKGTIPVLGDDYLGGHPGMNSKGVAYVHHGGMSGGGEPEEQWGYGVRRGAATFHALQFANTADEARDIMISLPVGDVGTILGSAGGMWADSVHGYSFEGREGSPHDPNPVIRSATYDALGEGFEFLYANNNALSPQSGKLGAPPRGGYRYTVAGGWFTTDPKQVYADGEIATIVRLLSKESECRNRFHYKAMMSAYGDIDLNYMISLYRTSGVIPEGTFQEVSARWHAGEQWDCSPAHRSIAYTVAMKPAADGTGTYFGCVGPLDRGLNTRDPSHGYYYSDETNALWRITLADTAQELTEDARGTAAAGVGAAQHALASSAVCDAALAELHRLLALAEAELDAGDAEASDDIHALARRVRCYARAQVRSTQVLDAVAKPAALAVAAG